MRPGVTEREVAGAIESALRRPGYERPAFDTIVASGRMPRCRTTGRATADLSAGDLVVLDFGGVLDGYCSDLTRTVSVGRAHRRMPAGLRRRPRRRNSAAIEAVRPGVIASAVDARGPRRARGARTGRGVRARHRPRPGLDVHEEPRIARPRRTTPRRAARSRAWSSPSSPAPISRAGVVCGSKTMCW